MGDINFVSAIVASFTGLVLGYLWYSVIFAKQWQHLAGVTDDQLGNGMAKKTIGSYLMTLIMSLNMAAFVGVDATPVFGLVAGLAAGIGWVAMGIWYELFIRA